MTKYIIQQQKRKEKKNMANDISFVKERKVETKINIRIPNHLSPH